MLRYIYPNVISMGTSVGWLKIGGKCPFEMVRPLPRRVVLKSKKIATAQHFEKNFGCAFGAAPFVYHSKFKEGSWGLR